MIPQITQDGPNIRAVLVFNLQKCLAAPRRGCGRAQIGSVAVLPGLRRAD